MRSPGVIYRRYRALRKKLLYDKIGEGRKKIHDNCHYGKKLTYTDPYGAKHITRLCLYGIEDGIDPDICSCPGECNAFVRRYVDEAIIERFEEELKDSEIKWQRYPDLAILEWVLDKTLTDAKKHPNIVGKLILFCITLLEVALKLCSKDQKNLMERDNS